MIHDRTLSEFDRALTAATGRCGAPLCVGLDPVIDRMPPQLAEQDPTNAFAAFTEGVIQAIRPHAAAVKFQSACYERYGSRGLAVLETGVRQARDADLAVILDAKRGDIGISATHYAAAAASMGVHAITVNAYLGIETLEPYLDAGLAIFVLVRTSNPGSADVQDATLRTGGTLAMHVGRLVADLGQQQPGVHAVVGATQHEQAQVLRAVMPDQTFLLPGLGAQGAGVGDLLAFAKHGEHAQADPCRGLLPTASRSVIYPGVDSSNASWADGVASAAQSLNLELAAALRSSAGAMH